MESEALANVARRRAGRAATSAAAWATVTKHAAIRVLRSCDRDLHDPEDLDRIRPVLLRSAALEESAPR
jgi:hypothetical protein